jgi:hypothetical protein
VRLLIEKGVDMTIQNNKGDTPLLIAQRKDYPDIVTFLMRVSQKLFDTLKIGEHKFDPDNVDVIGVDILPLDDDEKQEIGKNQTLLDVKKFKLKKKVQDTTDIEDKVRLSNELKELEKRDARFFYNSRTITDDGNIPTVFVGDILELEDILEKKQNPFTRQKWDFDNSKELQTILKRVNPKEFAKLYQTQSGGGANLLLSLDLTKWYLDISFLLILIIVNLCAWGVVKRATPYLATRLVFLAITLNAIVVAFLFSK